MSHPRKGGPAEKKGQGFFSGAVSAVSGAVQAVQAVMDDLPDVDEAFTVVEGFVDDFASEVEKLGSGAPPNVSGAGIVDGVKKAANHAITEVNSALDVNIPKFHRRTRGEKFVAALESFKNAVVRAITSAASSLQGLFEKNKSPTRHEVKASTEKESARVRADVGRAKQAFANAPAVVEVARQEHPNTDKRRVEMRAKWGDVIKAPKVKVPEPEAPKPKKHGFF